MTRTTWLIMMGLYETHILYVVDGEIFIDAEDIIEHHRDYALHTLREMNQ